MPERITVVGLHGSAEASLSPAGRSALHAADLLVAGRRHLEAIGPVPARTVAIGDDVPRVLDAIAGEPGAVCVVASGDPGFFGILRPIVERFGTDHLTVHPAPSSVALAFASVGLPWDDALVVSAHGRPLGQAARAATSAAKVAVLTSPASPPEALGAELLALGARHARAVVCSRLGLADEQVRETDLAGLAGGTWDPLSVVLLLGADAAAGRPTLCWGPPSPSCDPSLANGPLRSWGLPDEEFDHRAGMVTKSEVRAVALGKLGLPRSGVLWDVGAGSGSVAIEAARLSSSLEIVAIEQVPDDAGRIRANALRHGVVVRVIEGVAPHVFEGLADPDRVFVGGGGLAVLEQVLERLRPGGRVVATYTALDRAVRAAERLGELVQLSAARGERLPDGGLRLAAENPVFVVWGPPR